MRKAILTEGGKKFVKGTTKIENLKTNNFDGYGKSESRAELIETKNGKNRKNRLVKYCLIYFLSSGGIFDEIGNSVDMIECGVCSVNQIDNLELKDFFLIIGINFFITMLYKRL